MQELEQEVRRLEQEPGSRRPRLDSRESLDRELVLPSEPSLLSENMVLKQELDCSRRERRVLAARIEEWQQELGREQVGRQEQEQHDFPQVLDDEGLRSELRQAIKTLQIKDHKLEEVIHAHAHDSFYQVHTSAQLMRPEWPKQYKPRHCSETFPFPYSMHWQCIE